MSKPERAYKAIDIDDLRKVRGHPLSHLMRGREKIPSVAGLYIWRYWPSLANVDKETFFKMWERWKNTQPQFEEEVNNSRIKVSVRRTPFGISNKQTDIFGFDRESTKAANLARAIDSDAGTRQMLAYTMESLVSAIPPLYIGKADNLRARLSDHFNEQSSSVIQSIRDSGISHDDIYISFIIDPVTQATGSAVTTALEEIIQRMTNPPLTKRFG